MIGNSITGQCHGGFVPLMVMIEALKRAKLNWHTVEEFPIPLVVESTERVNDAHSTSHTLIEYPPFLLFMLGGDKQPVRIGFSNWIEFLYVFKCSFNSFSPEPIILLHPNEDHLQFSVFNYIMQPFILLHT